MATSCSKRLREWNISARFRTTCFAWMLAALLFGIHVEECYAKDSRDTVKKQLVIVRILGRAEVLPISSFGANYHSYVAVVESGAKEVTFIKLLYRFMDHDGALPSSWADYELVHKFHATRQPECDEAADSMLYSQHRAHTGELLDREFSFTYARNAHITIPETAVLPCYVVSPRDHDGSKRVPLNISASTVAAKK